MSRSLSNYAGMRLGVSHWVQIDQHQIDLFAEATGDKQYIHTHPELAKTSPFGRTIAHGLLTLSLIPQWLYPMLQPLCPQDSLLINYGIDKLRFLHPVKCDDYIRCAVMLNAFEERAKHEWLLKLGVEVEIHNIEKQALVADVLTLMFTGDSSESQE